MKKICRFKNGFLLALAEIFLLIFLVSCQYQNKSIQGRVVDESGNPIPGAIVRIKATEIETLSSSDGSFILDSFLQDENFFITTWSSGYYINGVDGVQPGDTDLEIILHAYHTTDNPDYKWLPSTYHEGQGENQGCAQCHSSVGSGLSIMLPVDEWLLDAHAQSALNPRFLSMYAGTDLDGNQSPQTRYGYSKDYGRFPLQPDLTQPYYGPGYKLDFPNTTGNCAACHTPGAAVNNAYSVDPTLLSGTDLEGISCDFCHKIWDVNLDQTSGLPFTNTPGVLSFEFLRPPEGHQFFAGPLDDVAPGEDTFSALQTQSQFCAPCHYGVFWDTLIYNSFGEWLDSPYSNPDTGKTCQDCHMPPSGAVYFGLPDQGAAERDPETIFSHLMPGASDETLLQNAVSMDLEVQHEGDQVLVEVTITNDQTGHHVPTDSPLRQIILLVNAVGSEGTTLELMDGPTLPDWTGVGDPSLGYFSDLPGKAYAKVLMELWTEVSPSGAYWNPTRILSDNRIPALGCDTSRYVFQAPSGESIRITAELFFRRAFIDLADQKGWNTPDILMERQELELMSE